MKEMSVNKRKKDIIFANPQRILKISLPYENALVCVYDIFGRKVREFNLKTKEFIWDFRDKNGKKLGTGIYTLRIKTNDNQIIKKIIHIK
jgi:flagellar hook assembly protein FlgD